MIEIILTAADGTVTTTRHPDDRLDEILARADAAFLPPMTAEDEIRYQEIVQRMMEGMK